MNKNTKKTNQQNISSARRRKKLKSFDEFSQVNKNKMDNLLNFD